MIYNLILNELISVIGNFEISTFQFKTLEIFSIILSIIFVLIFLSIPLIAFYNCLFLFNIRKKRRRRK